MDRQIVYIGQIPQDTDMLLTNKDAYIALSKIAAAVLGVSTLINAFTCVPTSPASMQVNVTPGEIYSLQNIDNSGYGSIPSDTSHSIMKQGVALNNTTLTLTAPGTPGNSWNILIQIGFSETDGGSTVLPYYNASNPSVPWSGPGNDGSPQNTIRQDGVTIQAKTGVQAPTGTQVTPSPDIGFVGAFVVTVANGQSTITAPNISTYSGAPFITETLTQKISQATADTRYAQITAVQNGQYLYGVDTSVSANTLTASLSPAVGSYSAGMEVNIKVANTNTGASTLNLNSLGAKNIVLTNGGAISAGDLYAGGIAKLVYDGTNFELRNPASNVDFNPANIQNSAYIYASSTTAANTYTASLSPALTAYTAGVAALVKFTNANTGSATINFNSLGAKTITHQDGNTLNSGDIAAGMVAFMVYDGTNFQLISLSPANLLTVLNYQNNTPAYISDSGSVNAYAATLSPAIPSYTTGLRLSVKIANTNTSTTPTLNVNSLGTKTITYTNGSAINIGDLVAGQIAQFAYDGTNFQLLNPATFVNSAQFQNATQIYAASTTAANTYTATLSPAPAAYTTGMSFLIKFTNANTGAATLNINSLGAKTITRPDGTALVSGDIYAGMIAAFSYDGTNLQLKNPMSLVRTVKTQTFTSSGTYTPSAGMIFCIAEGVGSGGAGGGSVNPSASQNSVGSGGGAGGYFWSLLTASQIGASQAVTINVGGSGNSGADGGNGGTTSLGSLCSASGGLGGHASASSTALIVTNLASGGSTITGQIQIIGKSGFAAVIVTAGQAYGGRGGDSQFGQGGEEMPNTANGNAATSYGAGGGGSNSFNAGGAKAGGAGSGGFLRIIEFCTQ